jgi:hypothetical protein
LPITAKMGQRRAGTGIHGISGVQRFRSWKVGLL